MAGKSLECWCLLSIQVSAQLKRVVLMKNWLDWIIQSSWLFPWTYLLPKTLVRCWGIENAIMLSDYFDHSFGRDYALLINEWHLLAPQSLSSILPIRFATLNTLDNINSEPNFEAAIAATKAYRKNPLSQRVHLVFETEDFCLRIKYKFKLLKQLPYSTDFKAS